MDSSRRIRVAELAELRSRGVIVVGATQRRVAVFADGEDIYAVENNCPHMGFPLDRGSVRDGILTCHWHQARFDLRSGCTFDLWADDVARYEVEVDDDVVYIAPQPAVPQSIERHRERFMRGIEQNIGLVQAKSLLALMDAGEPLDALLTRIVRFASHNLAGMSEGLIRLGCVARLFEYLSAETAYQGLYYATRQIASETNNAVPRRERQALDADSHDLTTLKGWLRQWVMTRHRDGAERTVLTASHNLSDRELADLVFTGATERLYAGGGHHMEDCNKAFELDEIAQGIDTDELLPLLMTSMTGARGSEESTNWHHPIELVEPLRTLEPELEAMLALPRDDTWQASEQFTEILAGDDPLEIIEAIKTALAGGAPAQLVARQVAFVAASRLARFATSNEVTDWFNPQHTFIFTNATYQAVRRAPSADVVRAIFQGAISVYMDRFLNVPPARLPSERNVAQLPDSAEALLDRLLGELDKRANIDDAADLVAAYLDSGFDFARLVDTLTFATVREDLDFHSVQVLEAAVNQCKAWDYGGECMVIMVGVVRNLAAHCPTRRAGQQTAVIARRLHQGDKIFEDA